MIKATKPYFQRYVKRQEVSISEGETGTFSILSHNRTLGIKLDIKFQDDYDDPITDATCGFRTAKQRHVVQCL